MSFVDNFSEAIEVSNGEYVCMIGDDDAILPIISDVLRITIDNSLDAMIPGLNSVYIWPSNNPFVKNGENGYLCIAYLENKYKIVSVEKGLDKLLSSGGQNYQNCDVPRIYHGIVKRDLLDKIKSMTGVYFDGLTPDIYMSTALSLVCKRCARINYPITVSGICPKSGSADSATGRHTGELKDAPHFKGHQNYIWDKKIPEIYSVESIWAESLLHALNNFGRDDLYKVFNIERLNAECVLKYPQFKSVIYKHIIDCNACRLRFIGYCVMLRPKNFFLKVIKRIFRKPDSVKKMYGITSISEAVLITTNEIRRIIDETT